MLPKGVLVQCEAGSSEFIYEAVVGVKKFQRVDSALAPMRLLCGLVHQRLVTDLSVRSRNTGVNRKPRSKLLK